MTNIGTPPAIETETDISLASSPTLSTDSCSPSRPTFGRALSSDLTVIQTASVPVPHSSPVTSSAVHKETHPDAPDTPDTLQPTPHTHEHGHEHDPEHHHHIHLHDLIPESPIDGGLKGWLAVLGSFLIHCFAFAPTEFVFGIFELHYHSVFPDATSSSIAFIGTTGSAVTYIAGFLSGIIADRFGFRGTALCGTVVMTISLVLASFSTKVHPHLYMQPPTHDHFSTFNPPALARTKPLVPLKLHSPANPLLNAHLHFHTASTAGSSDAAYLHTFLSPL